MTEVQLKTALTAFVTCALAAAAAMVIPWKWAWVAVGLTTGIVLGYSIKLKFGGFLGLTAAAILMLTINDEYRVGAVVAGMFAILSAAFTLFARMQYANFQKPPR